MQDSVPLQHAGFTKEGIEILKPAYPHPRIAREAPSDGGKIGPSSLGYSLAGYAVTGVVGLGLCCVIWPIAGTYGLVAAAGAAWVYNN